VDNVKNQAKYLASIYSNRFLLEIMDKKLFIKDEPCSELSSTPKNILAETLEMPLIDLFPNISIALRIFLCFPCQS